MICSVYTDIDIHRYQRRHERHILELESILKTQRKKTIYRYGSKILYDEYTLFWADIFCALVLFVSQI